MDEAYGLVHVSATEVKVFNNIQHGNGRAYPEMFALAERLATELALDRHALIEIHRQCGDRWSKDARS